MRGKHLFGHGYCRTYFIFCVTIHEMKLMFTDLRALFSKNEFIITLRNPVMIKTLM